MIIPLELFGVHLLVCLSKVIYSNKIENVRKNVNANSSSHFRMIYSFKYWVGISELVCPAIRVIIRFEILRTP